MKAKVTIDCGAYVLHLDVTLGYSDMSTMKHTQDMQELADRFGGSYLYTEKVEDDKS